MAISSQTGASGPHIAGPSGLGRAAAPAPARRWHGLALAGFLVLSGGAVLIWGAAAAQDLLSVPLMTIPALFGAVTPQRRRGDQGLLALWAAAAALAVTLSGGLSGPFAVFCLMPVFAALARDGEAMEGALFGALALVLAALAPLVHLYTPAAPEPARTWLAVGGVAVCLLLGAVAMAAARESMRQRLEMLDERIATLKAVLRELPAIALVLSADGRVMQLLGPDAEVAPPEAFAEGLLHAAAPETRDDLAAALDKAWRLGRAEGRLTLAARPEAAYGFVLRRMSGGSLVALLRLLPGGDDAPVSAAVSAPAPAGPGELQRLKTALLEAEEAREAAEGLAESRMRFLANTSHELRTPLNAIMGFSDMMRARMFGDLAPKYGEYADLIHESGGHLLALINDILDVSKIEARRYQLTLETFDAREPLNDALRLVRLQADVAAVRLRADLPKAPLLIEADRRAVKQMALNLLSNALKFTPSGGVVFVKAARVGEAVEIVVADTGVGISTEDLKRVGRPFEQAGPAGDRARGTGLGLSLVSALAQLHGGGLSLESRLGAGTAATLTLPVEPPATSPRR